MSVGGLEAAWGTDAANGAQPNEDRVACEPLPEGAGVLVVVSDGMGGHSAGDTASTIVCEVLLQAAPALGTGLPAEERFEALLAAFQKADASVRETAARELSLTGMGATALAAAITPATCLHAHTGDSRLYHFRAGERLYRTQDHSVVELKREIGEIDEEGMQHHPMRNMLLASIGGGGTKAQLDVAPKWREGSPTQEAELRLEPGDLILLCTDGLNGVLGEATLQETVRRHYDAPVEALVETLIEAAKGAGGADNVTIAAVRVVTAPTAADSGAGTPHGTEVPSSTDTPPAEALEGQEDSAVTTDASPQALDNDQVLTETDQTTRVAPDPEASAFELRPRQDGQSTS